MRSFLPLTLALMLPAPVAEAWTEANVQSAVASVEVAPDGAARVGMLLTVHIHGGWLEGLEVAGLDEDLVLDETKRPWATGEDGEKFSPEVRISRDGVLQFSFRGRGRSPRRGTIVIGFVYHTELAHRTTRPGEDETIVVGWTLPGWRSGLDAVEVDLSLPGEATSLLENFEDDASIRSRVVPTRSRTIVRFHRAHLPRTVPWRVEAATDEAAMIEELRAVPVAEPKPQPEYSSERTPEEMLIPVLALLGFWLVGHLVAHRSQCRRRRLRARATVFFPELPLPDLVRAPLIVGPLVATYFVWEAQPFVGFLLALAATLLTLRPTPKPHASGPDLTVRTADRSHHRIADRQRLFGRLGLRSVFDLSAPLGIVATTGIAFAAFQFSEAELTTDPYLWGTLALFFAPPASTTRFHLPDRGPFALRELRQFAGQIRMEDLRLRLDAHHDEKDDWIDSRLSLTNPLGETVELSVCLRPGLGGMIATIVGEDGAPVLLEQVELLFSPPEAAPLAEAA
ncbi:MAG: hypothetical protein AAGF12_25920 [Myxococcota bacterium]